MKTPPLSSADISLLEATFFFKGTQGLAVSAVRDGGCSLAAYKKGRVIFSPHSFSHGIAFILEGSVLVTKEPQPGRRLIMSELHAGSVFGAATLFNDYEEYVTTLTASSPSRVLFFGPELVERLMRENFRVTENYLRYLSGRVRFLNLKIDFLAAGSGAGKLLNWLRSRAGEGGAVRLEGSLSALAEELSMGRASLYRALDELTSAKMILREGKTIYLL